MTTYQYEIVSKVTRKPIRCSTRTYLTALEAVAAGEQYLRNQTAADQRVGLVQVSEVPAFDVGYDDGSQSI